MRDTRDPLEKAIDRAVAAQMAKENRRLRELNAVMLAALQRIDGINDNPAIYNRDIDDIVRAAIAKATGGK